MLKGLKMPAGVGGFAMRWVLFAVEWFGIAPKRQAKEIPPQNLNHRR